MKRPAFQFYPADWRKDVELRSCSISARGLWIDMMCIAHECEPYGHLTINGKPMTAAQIAGQVGLVPAQAKKLIEELVANGVARLSDTGTIYSKRMVDDEDLRNTRAEIGRANGAKGAAFGALGAEHGKKGGRPKGGERVSEPGEKPPQNPRPSSSSSSSSSEKQEKGATSALVAAETEKPAASAAPTPRGNRLPAGWALPASWGEWALSDMGWSVETIRLEAAKFADHWHAKTGKDATKADWQATWRNWCRNARPPIQSRAQMTGDAEAARRAASDAEAKRLLGFNTQETFDA